MRFEFSLLNLIKIDVVLLCFCSSCCYVQLRFRSQMLSHIRSGRNGSNSGHLGSDMIYRSDILFKRGVFIFKYKCRVAIKRGCVISICYLKKGKMSWLFPAKQLMSTRAYICEKLDREGTGEPNFKRCIFRHFRII